MQDFMEVKNCCTIWYASSSMMSVAGDDPADAFLDPLSMT